MAPVRIETGIQVAGGRFREHLRAELAVRISNSKSVVLELDETGEALSVWHWYVD